MKLAVTHENGIVFQHFGKTSEFKIYDITADGTIGFSMVIGTAGQGHAALAGFLRALGISVVICGGIGQGAQDALRQLDITVIPGVSGETDGAVADFLTGKLTPDTAALCQHHHEAAGGCGGGHCGGGCGCH